MATATNGKIVTKYFIKSLLDILLNRYYIFYLIILIYVIKLFRYILLNR